MLALIAILLIVEIIAGCVAIDLFIKVGKAKGYAMDNSGLLWFIGICAPLGELAVGLYVAALPDNRLAVPTDPLAPTPSASVLPSLDANSVPTASAAMPAVPASKPEQPATPCTDGNDLPAL